MAKNHDAKISVAALDHLLSNMNEDIQIVSITCGEDTLAVKVKQHIGLQEYCDMVQEAAETCFQMDQEGGEHYLAGVEDFARSYALLKYMTNVKTAGDVQRANQQNDRLYALCSNTDLMEKIRDVLPRKFLYRFDTAVCSQIEFRKQQMLSTERQQLLSAIHQIDKANVAFAKFVEMFHGVDPSAMMDMMQKITAMDEERLGAAVVNARERDFVGRPISESD